MHAIRVVARGDALVDPAVTLSVITAAVRRDRGSSSLQRRADALTGRELDILRLLARGLSNGEIAERLVVSEATVKPHVGHVLGKLGVRDRVQAVVFAFECRSLRLAVSNAWYRAFRTRTLAATFLAGPQR